MIVYVLALTLHVDFGGHAKRQALDSSARQPSGHNNQVPPVLSMRMVVQMIHNCLVVSTQSARLGRSGSYRCVYLASIAESCAANSKWLCVESRSEPRPTARSPIRQFKLRVLRCPVQLRDLIGTYLARNELTYTVRYSISLSLALGNIELTIRYDELNEGEVFARAPGCKLFMF